AAEVIAVALIWILVDKPLAVGLGVLFAALWLPRLAPLYRLAVEVALVVVFALAAATDKTVRSVPLVLAVAFALSWLTSVDKLAPRASPSVRRYVVRPASKYALGIVVIVIAFTYPFFVGHLFTIPFFGAFPDVTGGTATVMLVYVMMALGLNIVVGYAG